MAKSKLVLTMTIKPFFKRHLLLLAVIIMIMPKSVSKKCFDYEVGSQ